MSEGNVKPEVNSESASTGLLGPKHTGMKDSSKSMVSIPNSESVAGIRKNDRARDISILLKKGCTCPKPLISVLDICSHCVLTYSAILDNRMNSEHANLSEPFTYSEYISKFPLAGGPISKRVVDTEDKH